MDRLTAAERISVIRLFKQRRNELVKGDVYHTHWGIFGYVAGQLHRSPVTIRDLLVAEGVIDPPAPRIGEVEMCAIAADYVSGMTIRACAEKYGRSYGTIRKTLVFKRVTLRMSGDYSRSTPDQPG